MLARGPVRFLPRAAVSDEDAPRSSEHILRGRAWSCSSR
jgi:hypothetical protein